MLESEYVRGHISVYALLRGQLDVWRVEADGVDVNVDRLADGRVPMLDRFVGAWRTRQGRVQKQAVAGGDKIDLTLHMKVEVLRLTHVRARFRDFMYNPPIEDHLALNVRVSDLGPASARPTRVEIDVACDPLLDALRIEGEGRAAGEMLDADIRVKLPASAAARRALPGAARHPAGRIGFVCRYDGPPRRTPHRAASARRGGRVVRTASATTRPGEVAPSATQPASPGGAPPAQAIAARLELKGISATADAEEAASLKRFVLEADTLSPTVVHVTRLAVEGGRAKAKRMPDGTFEAVGLAFGPSPNPSQSKSNPLAFLALSPKGFHGRLDELSVRDVRAAFSDGAVAPG